MLEVRFNNVPLRLLAIAVLIAWPATAQQPDPASPGSKAEDGKTEDVRSDQPTVKWSIDSSHAAMPLAGERLFLRVRVDAPATATPGRQALNLAFVFDRSNSMSADKKIEYLRKAAHLAVDNLKPADYVALVAYHHEVETLVPMHPAVNREYLHDRIDEIEPDGYTNISGGLLEGIAQVQTRLKQPGLHHLVLMTDGEANRGITDANTLVDLARKAAAKGMTVSTIGIGIEFNEVLLGRMAQAGNGRYLFVKQADQIPEVLQKELGSLLGVVAQNAKITLKLPAGLEVAQVFGRHEPLKPGNVEVALGDLTSGQSRRVVIALKASNQAAAVTAAGQKLNLAGTLSLDNLATLEREQSERSLAFDPTPVAQPPLSDVLAYARLVEAVDKMGRAVKGGDEKLAGEVLQFRQAQFPVLKQIAVNSREQDFLNKAFVFEHYVVELAELVATGKLQERCEACERLHKDLHYSQHQMEHHNHAPKR